MNKVRFDNGYETVMNDKVADIHEKKKLVKIISDAKEPVKVEPKKEAPKGGKK